MIDTAMDLGYLTGVDWTETSRPDFPAEKLALARQAFREFHARCFWFMRRDAEIVAEEVPYLCERLRADGGRRGFQIAAELCR
jgi:hypothetical protein